jgi:hypothetical protein
MSAVAVARNPIKASETPDTVVLQHIARTPSSAATLWTPSILSASSLWVSIFGIWRIWRRLGCVRTTVMFFWCPFSTGRHLFHAEHNSTLYCHACHATQQHARKCPFTPRALRTTQEELILAGWGIPLCIAFSFAPFPAWPWLSCAPRLAARGSSKYYSIIAIERR